MPKVILLTMSTNNMIAMCLVWYQKNKICLKASLNKIYCLFSPYFHMRTSWLLPYLICVSNSWSLHQIQICQFPTQEVACPGCWISFPSYFLHCRWFPMYWSGCQCNLRNYFQQIKRYYWGGKKSGLDLEFCRLRSPGWERHSLNRWHKFSPECGSLDSSMDNDHLLWDPRVLPRHECRKIVRHLVDSLRETFSQICTHHFQNHLSFLLLQR